MIELVVVIAIIGVLAAILVPAMLGYVRRSKITTSNNAAKSIYNALNVSLVEMEAADLTLSTIQNDDYTTNGASIFAQKDYKSNGTKNETDLMNTLYSKVCGYFSDVQKIDDLSFRIGEAGCAGVGVIDGRYPGTYPLAITVEDYKARTGAWDSESALVFAMKDPEKEE